jgi:hypothetical protein
MSFREGPVDAQLVSYLYELSFFCPVVRLRVIADLALLYDVKQFLFAFEKTFDIKLIFQDSL